MKKYSIKDKRCNNKNNFYKTNPRGGISLIVLVITIIVIIILATAIIISLVKSNPIDEANKARYQSDRDNMQSIFTNTVAKVMAEKKVTIGVKACELNEVKSGTSSAVGETIYTIDNVESGKIIFDSENNTETDYYTGKRLPIYSKETTWHVDTEGILKLKVGNTEYVDNGGKNDSTNIETPPSENPSDNVTIAKEEYENLKNRVERIEGNQDKILKDNEEIKKMLEEIGNGENTGNIRAGQVTVGPVTANSRTIQVTFKEPMKDTNYSVNLNVISNVDYWAQTEYLILSKTINGFVIAAYNNGGGTSGNLIVNYIAVPYTE